MSVCPYNIWKKISLILANIMGYYDDDYDYIWYLGRPLWHLDIMTPWTLWYIGHRKNCTYWLTAFVSAGHYLDILKFGPTSPVVVKMCTLASALLIVFFCNIRVRLDHQQRVPLFFLRLRRISGKLPVPDYYKLPYDYVSLLGQ